MPAPARRTAPPPSPAAKLPEEASPAQLAEKAIHDADVVEAISIGAHGAHGVDAEDAAGADDALTQKAREALEWPKHGPGSKNAFTALEIAEQLDAIQEWLTLGYRPNEIRRLCCQRWGLNTNITEKRIQDARSRIIRDINVLDRPAKVAQMVEQLEQVLQMSIATKQGSNAIGALRLQADLLQLLARHQ